MQDTITKQVPIFNNQSANLIILYRL